MPFEPVYTAVEVVARGLSGFQGVKVTRTGTENVPVSGGAVIAINHTSYLDFIPAALAVGTAKRKLRVMAKAELADNQVLGFRSEERRVGKGGGRTCRCRWSAYH